MDERNNDFDFDFTPIGLAIKKARTAQGMTREQLARIVDYDTRHLQAIENEGQKPSLELFIQLMTMFNISVDEYIFPNIGLIVGHTALPPIAFIQLFPCFGQLIAVISPEIIRAVFAVPTHIGVGCFVVMTDNKLIIVACKGVLISASGHLNAACRKA